MQSFLKSAYIKDQHPSYELFEDLLLHGEILMLGTDYTEEFFFSSLKSPKIAKFNAGILKDFIKYFYKFINVISFYHAYFRLNIYGIRSALQG